MADDPKIIKSSLSVSDVFGNLEVGEIENYLHTRCKAEIMNVDAASELMIFNISIPDVLVSGKI